jgi:hypothetical protein
MTVAVRIVVVFCNYIEIEAKKKKTLAKKRKVPVKGIILPTTQLEKK